MCPMRAPKDQKSEDNQYEDEFCKIRHLTLNGRAPKGGAQLTAPHEALVGERRRSSSLYPRGPRLVWTTGTNRGSDTSSARPVVIGTTVRELACVGGGVGDHPW
jgi:hypothetical protein